MPHAIKSSIQEYVNNNWVKPLFDNIKKYVDGDKPVFAVYIDADAPVSDSPSQTFSGGSSIKEGMRFEPASNQKGLLNLVRIKKGDNKILNVVPALTDLANNV